MFCWLGFERAAKPVCDGLGGGVHKQTCTVLHIPQELVLEPYAPVCKFLGTLLLNSLVTSAEAWLLLLQQQDAQHAPPSISSIKKQKQQLLILEKCRATALCFIT